MAISATGSIGQIQGPFSPTQNVADIIGKREYGEDEYGRTIFSFYAKIGISVGEKDSMVYKTHDISAGFIPETYKTLKDLQVDYPYGYIPKEEEFAYKKGWIGVVQPPSSEGILPPKEYYVYDYNNSSMDYKKEWKRITEEEALANKSFEFNAFPMYINRGKQQEALIWMGWSDMYETDENPIEIYSIYFPLGAPASVFIDYVIMEKVRD